MSDAETEKLRAEVSSLKAQLAVYQNAPRREKIDVMSSEVVDSNPYSRLMALQKMKIVDNYQSIRDKIVCVVGLGGTGVGSVAAEMLARCGVGTLKLFDYDTVELANMNRLFYTPAQAGMTKTEAATKTLQLINPDVTCHAFKYNICAVDTFEDFLGHVESADLVLGCVDNFEARMAINTACLEKGKCWFESGVSETAVSGHIQFIDPGITACFQCAPPLIVASGVDERTLKREGVCAASLPTTMGITSGLLVQNALKHLLNFGEVSNFLGYDALRDFFPSYTIRPNPECENRWCREWSEKMARMPKPDVPAKAKVEAPVVHEEDWGIEIESEEDENGGEGGDTSSPAPQQPEGLRRAYEDNGKREIAGAAVVVEKEEQLDELAAQLAALQ